MAIRRYRRNPGFSDGLGAAAAATYGRRPARKHRRRAKARRLPPRNRFGHFMKRSAAKARRAAPKRRASSGTRRYRRVKGRFATRYTPQYVRRQRRRPTKSHKHYRARVTIPRGRRIAGLVVRNPRTGELMPMATVVNPRRRRRRRRTTGHPRRHRRVRMTANPRRRRRVRNPRRRHHRRHARRNPGMGSLMGNLKAALPTSLGGVVGGALAGFVDTKLLTGRPTLSILAKLGVAVVGGMVVKRFSPGLANGLVGGAMGSIGYSVGVKMGGGMVAHSAAGAIKGLGDMAGEDPALNTLLSGTGFGVLLEGLGDGSVQQYLSGDMLAGGGSGDSDSDTQGLGVLLQ